MKKVPDAVRGLAGAKIIRTLSNQIASTSKTTGKKSDLIDSVGTLS